MLDNIFQIIYKIGTYSCITPRYNFKENVPNNLRIIYKYMAIIIYIIITVLFLYGEYLNGFEGESNSSNHFDFVITIFDTFLWVFICSLILWNSSNEKWHILLKILLNTKVYSRSNKIVLWQFVLGIVNSFLLLFINIYAFYDRISILIVYDILTVHITFVFQSVVFNILIIIRDQFKQISFQLRTKHFKNDLLENIRFIKITQVKYRRSLEACDLFNDLFGVILLFSTFLASFQLLDCINFGILSVGSNDTIKITGTIITGLLCFVRNKLLKFNRIKILAFRNIVLW